MEDPLRIFVGWDAKEAIAYDVLKFSIERRASIPVDIRPLMRKGVAHLYTRERGPTEATDFSMTRFLVPHLSDYWGMSLFMDCDMLCLADIAELIPLLYVSPRPSVWCCKHDYTPKGTTKMDGQIQTAYPRKNWSSFMVFNNRVHRHALTPAYVNEASGLELHRLQWARDDDIRGLPLEWNWLVGEYEPNPDAKVLHYTLGTPCLPGYEDSELSGVWHAEHAAMLDARAWAEA